MTARPGAAISITGLGCAVGATEVLTGVSFNLDPGERLAIVGPNGSGKSTLLRTVSGLRNPVRGSVRVDGVDLHDLRPRVRARTIAVVGQHEALPGDLLVGEVVALGLLPHRSPWAGGGGQERAAVIEALRHVDLADAVDRPADQLSGGEQRRVLLARGLVQDCPVLMLDEPTNHLDVRHQHDLLQRVAALGVTVVSALHDLDLAAEYFDRVAVLHAGGLLDVGAPDQVLTPATVHRAFGVEAAWIEHPLTGRPRLVLG